MADRAFREAVMAVNLLSPYVGTDERTLREAVLLFAETDHRVSASTLERLCRRNGVPMTKHGRTNYVSWTALLKLHRDWVHAQR